MDSAYIRSRVDNPRQHSDLDRIFRSFFTSPSTDDAERSRARDEVETTDRFDVDMYKGRMRITVDILLKEANARAKEANQSAYVVIVGLGLGVWKVDKDQNQYFVETFTQAIEELSEELDSIGTLDFSWISAPEAIQREVQAAAAANINANAIFTRRNPAVKLTGDAAKQLLVISYAWDGNAFPGNEYWDGSLSASGDPAAVRNSNPFLILEYGALFDGH